MKIFISYRRADSRKDAGRIYDRLVEAFGKDNIFKDIDSIPMGSDFRGKIREAVAQCEVQLAIIGSQWLDIKDEQYKRRLDNPGDFVRIEIESALQRDGCLVIPILVDNAPMPQADDLPPDLRELAFKNATVVRDDPDFHSDVSKIIRALKGQSEVTLLPASKPVPQATLFDVHAAISEFYRAFDAKEWERARQILTDIRISEQAPRVFDVDAHEQEVWDAIEIEERDKEYALLHLMLGRPNKTRVWEALKMFWQTYPGFDPDRIAEKVRPFSVGEILPVPFEWKKILEGRVTLSEGIDKEAHGVGKSFDIPSFALAKYPLTNAQYSKFIDAGGYQQKKWWTEAGWDACEQGWALVDQVWQPSGTPWTEPRFWQIKKWNGAELPVVGVSWYEAVAFCNWLSEITDENILLPTEQQWQRAAQGDDNRAYPWGNDWDASCCNNDVGGKGSKKTTPVKYYHDKGNSPFGVVDMAGNVWEWCLTTYQIGLQEVDGLHVRVLRGGAWIYHTPEAFHTSARSWEIPNMRGNRIGFRIARSLK